MNIFNYKPQLQYVLKDINTIDNIIEDEELKFNEPFIKNRGSITLESLKRAKDKAINIEKMIDEKLKDYIVPINNIDFDDLSKIFINQHPDSDKLLNEDKITYSMYKYSLGNKAMYMIKHKWDVFNAGIEGNLDAEMYPYILSIKEDLDSAIEIINQTVLYGKDFTNLEVLSQKELVEIEEFMRLNNEFNNSYDNQNIADEEQYKSICQQREILSNQIDEKEKRLTFNKTISNIITDFSKDASFILDNVSDIISSDQQQKNLNTYNKQSLKILNKIKNKDKVQLVIYRDFKSRRNKVLNKSKDVENGLNKLSKKRNFSNFITESRIYLDIAMPTLNNLDSLSINSDEEIGFKHVVNGLEDMIDSYIKTSIELKNTLESSIQTTKSQIREINNKNNVRMLYKSF